MWLCLTHKQKNRVAMEQFRVDMQELGHTLAMPMHIPLQACSAETEDAVKRIRRGQQKRGQEIVPVPAGEPLFVFYPTKCKIKDVLLQFSKKESLVTNFEDSWLAENLSTLDE